MELRHLRYFVAVAEELHFGNAAKRLNISQPPLSQQIQNLEAELGAQLFVRKQRRVYLTPAGKAFYEKATGTLNAAANAIETARRVDAGAGDEIAIGYNSAIMLSGIAPILHEFHRTHPTVGISLRQLSSHRQYEAVASGELDTGFVMFSAVFAKKQYTDEIQIADATQFPLVLAVPLKHKLATRNKVSINILKSEHFIVLARRQYATLHDRIISLCNHSGFSPSIEIEAEQMPAVLAYVAAGFGIALVPNCSIPGWNDSVAFLEIKETEDIQTHIISRKDPLKTNLNNFVKMACIDGQSLYNNHYKDLFTH